MHSILSPFPRPERLVRKFFYSFPEGEVCLSVEEGGGPHHTLRYEESRIEGDVRRKRRLELQVDRLYCLEILNGTIDDIRRLHLFYGIVGRRRFGRGSRTERYLLGPAPDLNVLRRTTTEPAPNERGDLLYYEANDRNLHIYQAHPLEDGDRRFVWLIQKNATQKHARRKSFLVELEPPLCSAFMELSGHRRKIGFLFEMIGFRYIHSLPFGEEAAETLFSEEGDPAVDREARRELASVADAIQQCSLRFLDKPDREEAAKAMEEALGEMAGVASAHPFTRTIPERLRRLAEMIQKGILARIFLRNDHHKGIFVAFLALLDEWAEALLDKRADRETMEMSDLELERGLARILERFDAVDLPASGSREGETISAAELVAELALDKYLMDELSELEAEIDNLLYEGAPVDRALPAAIGYFAKYERLLNTIYDFRGLAYALDQLVQLLEGIDSGALPEETTRTLVLLLNSLAQDLTGWRTQVLIEQRATDIHYMDDSLLSSIRQIERLTGTETEQPESPEVEIF